MSTLLIVSISILIVWAIVLAIVFPLLRKPVAAEWKDSVNDGRYRHLFREGLTQVDIRQEALHKLLHGVRKHIVGMDSFLHGMLLALLAHGHVLAEWAPGLAKTKTLRLLASLLDIGTKRIQFTPDMLPADIIGTEIFNQSSGKFDIFLGPLFTNILLADEINRATPKVQSALLEAMEEEQVTISGVTHTLPSPFFVLATQNPLEHEGTYILPEAQLDRFMMKLTIEYPSLQAEAQILEKAEQSETHDAALFSAEALIDLQEQAQKVHADKSMHNYIAGIITATRGNADLLSHGASPRGSLAVLSLSKALAFAEGRSAVEKNDVIRVLLPALRHRIALSAEAQMDGRTDTEVLYTLISSAL